MSKDERIITASNPTVAFSVGFAAKKVYVSNPTGSPVYLKIGTPQAPRSIEEADAVIPAASEKTVPALGNVFAASFADATLISNSVSGNLGSVATIIPLSEDEPTPSFGALSYLSISVSMLSNGLENITPTARIYDLGGWGGAMIFLAPDSGSGQAVIDLQVSQDGVTWRTSKQYAMWPGLPVTVNVPRIMRYLKLTVFATGIVGEPDPSGRLFVRGSLTEIVDYDYSPSGTPITKTYNVTPGGSVQYQLFTLDIPSISFAAVATAGTGAGAAITFLIEASSDRLNWRQVTFRNQVMSIGRTLYRTTGPLDLYVRITIFETSGANSAVGSLYISTNREIDTAYILNTIQQALGDNLAPTNTNQDIYHELDTIRIANAAILTQITAINTLETANLPFLSNLPNIKTDTASIVTNTGQLAKASQNPTNQSTAVGAGAWVSSGIDLTVGSRITYVQMSQLIVAANALALLQLAIGTNAGPTFVIYFHRPMHFWNVALGVTTLTGEPLVMQDGWTVLNGFARIWVQSTVAGQIDWTVITKN